MLGSAGSLDSSSPNSSGPPGCARAARAVSGAKGAARRRGKLAVTTLATGIVVVVVASVILLYPSQGATGTNCSIAPEYPVPGGQWYVLAPCHSTAELAPHTYYPPYQVVRLSDGEMVYGQFTANASIGAYLLNSTQVQALSADPHPSAPPPAYFWTCGTVPLCNLTVRVLGSPGQYYVVLENLNAYAASAEWTKTLAIYYAPASG